MVYIIKHIEILSSSPENKLAVDSLILVTPPFAEHWQPCQNSAHCKRFLCTRLVVPKVTSKAVDVITHWGRRCDRDGE